MSKAWRDQLFRLHVHGWNADDIDEACEALYESCREGAYEGIAVADLTTAQMRRALSAEVAEPLLHALRGVAGLREQQGPDADELQRALYDLDAFAYDFAGDT